MEREPKVRVPPLVPKGKAQNDRHSLTMCPRGVKRVANHISPYSGESFYFSLLLRASASKYCFSWGYYKNSYSKSDRNSQPPSPTLLSHEPCKLVYFIPGIVHLSLGTWISLIPEILLLKGHPSTRSSCQPLLLRLTACKTPSGNGGKFPEGILVTPSLPCSGLQNYKKVPEGI